MISEARGKGLLTAFAFFFLTFTAKGQCLEKGHFTYCPDRDTLYVLTDKHLEAFQVSENRVNWRAELPNIVDNSFEEPIVAADNVVVSAGFPTTRICSFDAKTGKLGWQLESSILSETARGPYVFWADARHWEGLTALEGGTGKLVWHHTAGRPGDIRFFASSGKALLTNIFAIDPYSGQVLKRWPKDWRVVEAASTGDLTMIGTEYAWPQHETLAVYSGSDYKLLWTRRDAKEPIVAGIAAEGDKMLVATYKGEEMFHSGTAKLEMMAARTGTLIWTKEIKADYMLLNTPVALAQGIAIFFMDDTADSSVVQAFDADTGAQKWRVHTNRRLVDGVICSGGRCLIGADGGEIAEIDARSGKYSWLAIPKD